MSEMSGAAMPENHDPAIEAALDRALAAMASPTIPSALMARMVAEIPQLPQVPADEGKGEILPPQERAPMRRRFARWGGLGAAVAASVGVILLFPRAEAPQAGAPGTLPAVAAAAAPIVPAVAPAPAILAAAPLASHRPAIAARRSAKEAVVPQSGREIRTADKTEAPPVIDPAETNPPLPAQPRAADERVAVTASPATVHEAEGGPGDLGADDATAIPALPAGPRAQGAMGFSGMGDMAAPAAGGPSAGGRR
jgi:hypothetical protein